MKVLIVESHTLFAEGLRLLLESYQEDVETVYARDFESAFKIFSSKVQFDLILFDMNISEDNDFSIISKIHNINIWIPILVISSNCSSYDINSAIDKGASGLVLKTSSSKTFLKAINAVIYGDVYRDNENVMALEGELYRTIKVTSRQHEVLTLLSQGMLNKQIALELSISANTVKAHLHDIFKLLQVKNRTAAVNYAYKNGLL